MKHVSRLFILTLVVGTTNASFAVADGLHIQNDTNEKIFVAVAAYSSAAGGYIGNGTSFGDYSPPGWSISGWYAVGPGQRITVRDKLHKSKGYCYYYAFSESRKMVWEGSNKWAISRNNAFKAFYQTDVNKYESKPKNSEMQGFLKVDYGKSREHTLKLTR